LASCWSGARKRFAEASMSVFAARELLQRHPGRRSYVLSVNVTRFRLPIGSVRTYLA
jgi:hypothetical protein